MPVKVAFRRTAPIGSQLTSENVEKALLGICRESIQELQGLIRLELLKRVSQVEITDEAKERIPALNNLASLLEKYQDAFRVEVTEEGVKLFIDRDVLTRQGLPKILPEMLEYGSRIGISPMAHLRTSKALFLREVARKLVAKVVSELG